MIGYSMFRQIISASDWFYVENTGDSNVSVEHVVAWGLTDNGKVIGFISVPQVKTIFDGDKLAGLTVPLSTENFGFYKHKDELSKKDIEALKAHSKYLEELSN